MNPHSIQALADEVRHSRVKVKKHVLYVPLDRPAVRNTLHSAAHHELGRVFDAYDADPELRVATSSGLRPSSSGRAGERGQFVSANARHSYCRHENGCRRAEESGRGSCRPFKARADGGSTQGSAPLPSTLGYIPAAASRLKVFAIFPNTGVMHSTLERIFGRVRFYESADS